MEKFTQYIFFAYIIYYVALMVIYFFNPKPLKRAMRYSTAALFVVIALVTIAVLISGKLFEGVSNIPYF